MPPPARAAKRVLLSSYGSAWGRQRVYRTPDALELEESENLRVSVRRVFFDEVLLVTRHREIGWLFLLAMAIGAAYFGFFSLMIGVGGGVLAGLGAFAASTLPFLVAFVLRVALGVDCVTVYGKRTRARLRFWLRKRRARAGRGRPRPAGAAAPAARPGARGPRSERSLSGAGYAPARPRTSGRTAAIRISTRPNVQTIVAPVGRSRRTDK